MAKLRDKRIQATPAEVERSLEGNWREDMLFELKQAVDTYDFIRKQMAECDQRLQKLMAELPAREGEAAEVAAAAAGEPAGKNGKPAGKNKKKSRGSKKNVPRFDLHAELERVCGVDLTSLDGIDILTAQTVVAELGTDFSRWKDETPFRIVAGPEPVPRH